MKADLVLFFRVKIIMADTTITRKESNAPASMYRNAVNIGTEEVTQEDLNTPNLKILQPTTQGIPNKQDGFFYRSDTKEQLESVDVNLVYVTTIEGDNYNKTDKERFKVYFGFYKDSKEPFKMFVRGWGLGDHRIFQTEIYSVKKRYGVPMLALTVRLTTHEQAGTIKESGRPYTIYRPLFTILKENGKPIIEEDEDRFNFLLEAARRFKEIASTTSVDDDKQNEIPKEEPPTPTEDTSSNYEEAEESLEEVVDEDQIPF